MSQWWPRVPQGARPLYGVLLWYDGWLGGCGLLTMRINCFCICSTSQYHSRCSLVWHKSNLVSFNTAEHIIFVWQVKINCIYICCPYNISFYFEIFIIHIHIFFHFIIHVHIFSLVSLSHVYELSLSFDSSFVRRLLICF
jgi:hypothetical protein